MEYGMLWALVSVVLIDLSLAGDNAIVIGMAAAGLPTHMRNRAILSGIASAAVIRIMLASVAIQLLGITGIMLVGGIALFWICWKRWLDILKNRHAKQDLATGQKHHGDFTKPISTNKRFHQAVFQIILTDLTMSLDNILAVAGAAHEHPVVMIIGLILSVTLMGIAASFVTRLIRRYSWIAYVGLAIIVIVSLSMIAEGSGEVIAYSEELISNISF